MNDIQYILHISMCVGFLGIIFFLFVLFSSSSNLLVIFFYQSVKWQKVKEEMVKNENSDIFLLRNYSKM